MTDRLSRRDWLTLAPGALGATLVGRASAARAADRPAGPSAGEPFLYGLNTATIRGQKLSIVEEVDLAAEVGYGGIEPWIRELDDHVAGGGSLEDLGKRIKDRGLRVESAIGFPRWAVDDEAERREGLEEARRNMEMLQKIGGKRLAAPPVGLTDAEGVDLRRVAERFRALIDLGERMGIIPELEVWGFSKTLSRLGEAAFVAIESGHPSACILADVYHLYRGGNDLAGLRQLNWGQSHVFHVNDYPATPARAEITDADRVYPGDGVAPLGEILRTLYETGFRGMLSIELFNKTYWQQDAQVVARRGLESMRAAVRAAGLAGQ